MANLDVRRETTLHVATLSAVLCSGFSGLIYEIVWFQQLSLILGASAVSLTILLSSFMGGLCLGSLLIPRWASRHQRPFRDYALLEFLIALFGLTAFFTIPAIGRIYGRFSFGANTDFFVRSAIAFAVMLPPTFLMGGTLPVILRRLEHSSRPASWIGRIYAANTFGAVLGSFGTGLYLLRCHDVRFAAVIAASTNCVVGLVAILLDRLDASTNPVDVTARQSTLDQNLRLPPSDIPSHSSGGSLEKGLLYLLVGLCGATALGAEVIWTRHLGLVLGPTVYSFSIILSAYLFGTGFGSSVGACLVRTTRSPLAGLAVVQFLLVGAVVYAAYATVAIVPYFLRLTGNHELFTVRVTRDLIRVAITILPATFLWGLTFPLAARLAVHGRHDSADVVGRLYAANTFGGIIGAAMVSLIGISYGGQTVQRILASTCLISGWIILLIWTIRARNIDSISAARASVGRRRAGGSVGLLIIPVLATHGISLIPPTPIGLLADGPLIDRFDEPARYRFVAEGLNSPIVVSEAKDGTRCFHVAGKIEASTRERDLRTQRLLGHLPALSCERPRKVLVVGCGSGITAGALLMHPTIEEIVICEIERTVIDAAREHFATYNYGVLENHKTKVVHDDARHFLSTTRENFDIITADPIHPWVKGSASLYTTEFFELCRSRLNSGGIMTLWVPLYESNEAAVKCELATFLQEFPAASIWSGQGDRVGYDLVVVGSRDNHTIELHQILSKFESNPSLQFSFAEMGLAHNEALQQRFVTFGQDLKTWLHQAQINRDANLRLQYLAGTNPDYEIAQDLLGSMLATRDRSADDTTPVLSVISPDEWMESPDM